MPCPREELEARERQTLAPYAQFSAESRGRAHPEAPPAWRTHYQRDRDRIIHSRAFRRLEYKTQVFLNGAGDHLRTRLTHTMEVAAIARNIARALRLNEDLVEAISLAHDLGHSPFGHSGEQVLNRLMKDHGGFEHNRQSLRVVEQLEQKYPRFPGLNLTWEVREGLLKHRTSYDHPDQKARASPRRSSLEAQVANLADEIAYYSHDLDDGLDARLLLEEQLWQEVAVWRSAAEKVKREHGRLPDECRRYFTIRCIIDELVQDVVLTTERQITNSGITSAEQARHYPRALAQHSARQQRLNRRLRGYLYANVYLSPAVRQLNARAAQMLTDLFQFYRKRPEEMGEGARARIETCGLHRAVCDYVAGMTDRYALGEYRRLLGGPSLLGAVNWPGPRRTFQR